MGIPKEYGDPKGGVRTSKEVWGETWGAGTPSGGCWGAANGVQQSFGVGERGMETPRGVWGWGGAGRPKGAMGTPQRGCSDAAKGVGGGAGGSGEMGMGTPEGVWGEMGCKDLIEGRVGVVWGGESQREVRGVKGGHRGDRKSVV